MTGTECKIRSSGEHLWCPCFGQCTCNKAFCNYCGAERPLTDEELAQKERVNRRAASI